MVRIIFMGSPEPAIHPLKALIDHSNVDVVAVVSQPARPKGRKRQLHDPDVAAFAKSQKILTLQPEKARDPVFLDELKKLRPDVIVTAAYGQILTSEFLAIPNRATINIHPSLLPEYRGAIPVQAALMDGKESTGVTILFTVKALDAGHIILQERFSIEPDEDATKLLDRMFLESGPLLVSALDKLKDPHFSGVAQDESKVSHCRKIAKDDGLIQWELPAETICNRFRAFQPWPTAYTYFDGKRVTLEQIKLTEVSESDPGKFFYSKPDKALRIGTGSAQVLVGRVKPEGGKSMDAASFWNGIKNKQELQFCSTMRAQL